MALDPNLKTGTSGGLITGWKRTATIDGVPVICNSYSDSTDRSFSFTNYALTPATGSYQKVMHARGTETYSGSMSGELSRESVGILNFLRSDLRSREFTVQSAQETSLFWSSCVMESFSLSGSPDSLVEYSLSWKSVSSPSILSAPVLERFHPIASWSTGRLGVESWNISVSIPQTAAFHNDTSPTPNYYRAGIFEVTMTLTSPVAHVLGTSLDLSIGDFAIISGVATSLGRSSSGDGHTSHEVTITNVDINDDAYTDAVSVGSKNPPTEMWPCDETT